MSNKIKLRIGGVPEHFNLPVHLAIEEGKFEAAGIEASWKDFAGGTGEMTMALRNNDIDLCILLTEGIIKEILKGNPSRMLSVFVNTPICWGVHTGFNNKLQLYDDIWDKRFSISRFGSGSHLMPLVDANNKDKKISDDQFVVIHNIESALQSLKNNETDVFYWEKFMTKPFVDNGTLRRIGEFYSPWPCFVIAGTEEYLGKYSSEVKNILEIIHQSNSQFMKREDPIQLISDRYGLNSSDAERWFHSTEWAEHGWISNKMIEGILYKLKLANIIPQQATAEELIWTRNKKAP